jgi:hypothetical protein
MAERKKELDIAMKDVANGMPVNEAATKHGVDYRSLWSRAQRHATKQECPCCGTLVEQRKIKNFLTTELCFPKPFSKIN